mgnify:CR=1 FL=1
MKNKYKFLLFIGLTTSFALIIGKFNILPQYQSNQIMIRNELSNIQKSKSITKTHLSKIDAESYRINQNINQEFQDDHFKHALKKNTQIATHDIHDIAQYNSTNLQNQGNYNLIGGILENNKPISLNNNINELSLANSNESNVSSNNQSNNLMYISEFNKNQITSCQISGGDLFNCKAAVTNILEPEALLTIENRLYISTMSGSIMVCNIDNLGNISNCNNNNANVNFPAHIAYNNGILYVTNFGFSAFSSCNLDSSGNIDQCNSASNVNIATFTNKVYNSFVYQLTNESSIKQTVISKCISGNNSGCQLENNNLFPEVFDFTFNSGYIYIIEENQTNYIVSCNLNTSGDFTDCQIVDNNLQMPTGITRFVIN